MCAHAHIYTRAHVYTYIHICSHTYNKVTLNLPTMGPTLSGPFMEVVGLGNNNIVMGDRLGPK